MLKKTALIYLMLLSAASTVFAQTITIEDYVMALPMEELSAAELSALNQMREEEKLARDVYIAMYEIWGMPVFNNISGSEQAHTDMVALLMTKYNLEDPFIDEMGVFANEVLQQLYTDLVAAGTESLAAALFVGCTIEDLDIYDLEEFMEDADNRDIMAVYQNLVKGSRNHMRAFYRQYTFQGLEYEVQFISEELLELILASEHEAGAVDENGDPLTACPDGTPLTPQNTHLVYTGEQLLLGWDVVTESVADCTLANVHYLIQSTDASGAALATVVSDTNSLVLGADLLESDSVRNYRVQAFTGSSFLALSRTLVLTE